MLSLRKLPSVKTQQIAYTIIDLFLNLKKMHRDRSVQRQKDQ